MADTDRYGLTAYYAFEVQNNAFATMDKVERGLHNIESAIRNLEKTSGTALGQKLNSTFGAASNNVRDLANEVKKTNNVLTSTASHLSPIKQEFRALRAESRNIDFGDLKNPAVFDQAKKSIHSYIAELDKLEAQITGTTAADRQFKSEIVRAKQVAQNKVDISGQQRVGANATERAGMATGVATAGAAIAMPLAMIGKKSIDTYKGFEDQLFAVEAVMDATQKTQANLDKIRDKSKQLGATTKFSASEAAGGFVLLAQAGYTVDQQLSAIDGTLKLAAAGSMGLAEATGYTLSSIGQFGLKAADSAHVADVMAKTANSAQLDVKDLGESLKYAGVNAKTYGASLEQTSAMIGVLSEAGLKGSEAGTVMRSVFTRLSAPTSEARRALEQLGVSVLDSSGKMRPVNQVLKDIHGGLGQLNDGQKAEAMKAIFGTEAIGGAQYLINNTGKINAYTDANYRASQGMGAATEAALTLEKGMGGSFRNFSSAWEGVLIEIGQVLAPVVKTAADALSKLMTAFIGLPQPMKTGIVIAGALTLGLASLAVVVGTLAIAYFSLQQAMASTGIASTLLKNGTIPLTGATQKIALAFGTQGFAGVMTEAGVTLSGFGTAIGTFATGALAALTSPIALTIAGFVALYAAIELLTPSINILGVILSVIAAPIGLVVGLLKGLATGFMDAFKPILTTLQPVAGQFTLVGDAIKQASAAFGSFAGAGENVGKILGFILGNFIVVPLNGIIAIVKILVGGIQAIGAVIDFSIIKPMQFVLVIASAIASPFVYAAQRIQTAWQGFVTWFLSMPLVQFAIDMGQGLINALNHSPTVKIPIAWEGAIAKIQGLMSFLVSAAQGVGVLLTGVFISPFQAILGAASTTLSVMGEMWQGFATWLTEMLTAVPRGVGNAFEKLIPPFLRDNGGNGGKKPSSPAATPPTQNIKPPPPLAISPVPNLANFTLPPVSAPIPPLSPQTSQLANPKNDIQPFIRPQPASQSVPQPVPGLRPAAPLEPSSALATVSPQVTIPVQARVQLETIAVFESVLQSVTNQIPQAQSAVTQGVSQVEQAYNDRASQAKFLGLSGLFDLDLAPIKQQFITLTQQTVQFAQATGTAIATLDFSKAQTGLQGYIGNLTSAIANISNHIGGMSLSVAAFGIASLASFSPVILIMSGVIIIAVAISRNFLGLRTILKGVFQVVSGVVQGFRRSLVGIIQIVQGIGKIFSGMSLAVRGDFSVMGEGIKLVFKGIQNIAQSVSIAVKQTFQGSAQILRGVFQGVEQVFSAVGHSMRVILRMLRGDFGRIGDGARSAFNLVRTVSTSTFKGVGAIASSVLQAVGKLFSGAKLHLNLESLRQSFSRINQLFERAKSVITGGIRAIASLPVVLNLSRISQLPNILTGITARAKESINLFTNHLGAVPISLNLAKLSRLPSIITAITSRAGDTMRSFTDRLNSHSIHLKTAVFEQLPGLVTATLEKVSHGWLSFTQRLDQVPVLNEFKAFIHTIPALFTAAVERVQAIWSGLTSSVGGFMDRITGKSKKTGKELVSNLAENSPGPTFQIRQKWKALAIALTGQMEYLSAHAQSTGGKISSSLSKVKFGDVLRDRLNKVGGGFSSLGSVVSNFSPQLAAPLFIAGDLVSSFDSLSESIPAAKKMFTEFTPKLAGLGDAAKKGIAPLKGAGLSMLSSLQGLSGQLIPKLSLMASTVFPMVATAASAAWTTVIAPLLPFIAGVALAVGAIALLTYAFRSNFLGVRTLVEGIASVLGFTLLMPFRVIERVITLISSGLKFMITAIAGAGTAVREMLLSPFTQLSELGDKVSNIFGRKPKVEPASLPPSNVAESVLQPVKPPVVKQSPIEQPLVNQAVFEAQKSNAINQIQSAPSSRSNPVQPQSQLVATPVSKPVLPSSPAQAQPIQTQSQPAPTLPQNPVQAAAQSPAQSPAQSIPPQPISTAISNESKLKNQLIPELANQTITQTITQDTAPARSQWTAFSNWFAGAATKIATLGAQSGTAIAQSWGQLTRTIAQALQIAPVERLREAIGGAVGQFNAATFSAFAFGLASLTSLSPIILIVAGIALGVLAIASNFLGIRTIIQGLIKTASGLFNIVRGAVESVAALIKTTYELAKGLTQILGGIPAALTGDFFKIRAGFTTVVTAFESGGQQIKAAFTRIGSGIGQTFEGLLRIARGVGQGIEQVFSLITNTFKGIGKTASLITSGIESAWSVLPQSAGAIFNAVGDRVHSALAQIQQFWSGLTLKLPDVNLAHLANLPAKIGQVIAQFENIFSAGIQKAQDIWHGLAFKLPTINLATLEILPAKVGEIIAKVGQSVHQIGTIFTTGVQKIKEVWTGLTSLNQVPILESFMSFVHTIPTTFAAVVDKIKALWEGVGDKLSSVFGFLKGKSKQAGRDLQSNLAEASPGPTFQIRMKWAMTGDKIRAEMDGIRQSAGVTGHQIGDRITAGMNHAAQSSKTKMGAIGQHLRTAAKGKGAAALGSTSSSIGMSLSNFAPQLATPLFMLSDLTDTASTLADSLPEAKKFFTGLAPGIKGLGTTAKSFIPMIGKSFSSIAPIIAGFGSTAITTISALIPVMSGFATTAIASFSAIIPVVLPFLPIIAAIAGGVALLYFGFKNNFLGIRSIVQAVGSAFIALGQLISYLLNPFRVLADMARVVTGALQLAVSTISGAWQGFSGWFGGMLGGLVQGGENAGQGLINALNHSPTIKIPIAWQKAVGAIGGFLGGLVDHGVGAGKLLSTAMSGMAAIAGQTVGKAFNHLTLAAASFGFSSLIALAPVGLALAGVGLAVFLVSRNFLGLKTIFTAVAQIIRGLISGITQALSGLINILKGIGNIIAGVFTGNLSRIGTGFKQVFGGAGQVVKAIASTISTTLGGSVQMVSGLLQGLKQIFSGFGVVIGSAFSSPRAMLEKFIGIIAQIEAKVKGVGAAIASSPIGKLAQAVGMKARGKTATIPEAQELVNFDQKLKNAPAAANQTSVKSAAGISQAINLPQPLSIPEQAQSIASIQTKRLIDSQNTNTQPQATPNRLQRFIGQPSSLFNSRSNPVQNIATPIANPIPIATQERPPVRPQSGISQAIKTNNDAPALAVTTGQKATQSLSTATDAAGSLAAVLSTIAPGLAAPINGFATLASGVMGLIATMPLMISSFASLNLGTLTWGGVTSSVSGFVSASFASVTATASSMWAGLVATYTTAGGISGIWALITSTASGIVSSGFASVTAIASGMGLNLSAIFGGLSVFSAIWGAVSTTVSGIVGTSFAGVATAASSMWLAVTGPMLPFVLAFLAAASLVFVAYQTNFMGIRQVINGAFGFITSVLGGIWSIISGTVGAIASIIGSILMQPIQAIGAAFNDIGGAFGDLFNAFITPLQPMIQAVQGFFSMFNQNTNQSASTLNVIKAALELAFLPIRIIFSVISTGIRVVGLAIAGIVRIVGILVSVLMIPVRILGVFVGIFQAIGTAFYSALIQPVLTFVGLIQGIASFFINLPGLVANAISAPFRAIQSFIQGIGQAIAGIPILGSIFTAISGVQPQPQQNQTPVQRFAKGGLVQGSGGTDSQNALVTPGEFILNPIASQIFRPILEGMNGGATSLMQLIPQLPPIPIPLPVPVPVGDRGNSSLPPISLQLNFGDIVIGQGGDRSNQDSMAIVSEFMDKIAPLLERQVVDILRATLEKAR
ncbi:MAG: phage tail tape measure protein [Timaviella obliquedivisa GSE-PSE-MK23-08B]|jgi:TP901 family phage tail tape measure protein|nr:phage tail tape measure protein [Timaviella obliquedivisa GSE-PSE-MK23-08B]